MKRKVLSVLLATTMLVTMAGCGNKESGSSSASTTSQESSTASGESSSAADSSSEGSSVAAGGEVEKPASIRVVCDGTVVTQDNGQAAFEEQLEGYLGLDVVFDQQDHSGYSDAVSRIFASGDLPDVILLNAAQYAAYAKTGILWDMTEAYQNAEFQSRLVSNVNDNLKIDGKMYGMTLTRGNGCLTYVKKAWLDAVELEVPTNYEEYYEMIKRFTENDPDGNGKNDTYGVSAAGIVGSEAPYVNYLPEFYQDAYPDFLEDESGKWYDGFDTDAMAAALQRLQDAYKAGYIDPETLTQGTKDARNKFYEDTFGVFTYWAGTWERNLMSNLEAKTLPTELIELPPIAEMGQYQERQTGVWAITTACENPEGVFKYFMEPMLDGGDVEFLWSYGAKGTHWDDKEQSFTCGDKDYSFKEGEFHMLPTPEKPDTLMTKNHIDQTLCVAPLLAENSVTSTDEVVDKSNQFFMDNSKLAPFIPSSDVLNDYNGDLWDIKNKVITEVVVNGNSVDEWMQYYRDQAGTMAAEVLEDLNK